MKKISIVKVLWKKKVMGQRGTILDEISMKALSGKVPFKLKPNDNESANVNIR